MFGLRAQVNLSLFPSTDFTYAHAYRYLFSLPLVILVAEHFITGNFLCSFHIWKLYHIALFREGEAVNFEGVGFKLNHYSIYCKQYTSIFEKYNCYHVCQVDIQKSTHIIFGTRPCTEPLAFQLSLTISLLPKRKNKNIKEEPKSKNKY